MKEIGRRDFLKIGAAGAASLALPSCGTSSVDETVAGQGEMTMRVNPGNGDRVSLLGYGCMRWPMKKDENGKDIIDQEKVNRLVDYAIEHGVNYFDAAPPYIQGMCEKATGDALSRHPRESYFIATKLSNFGATDRETALNMYRRSFENLQVDYIDYYLLHSLGGGGMKKFEERYIDNGVMDFLLEERKAGRIRNLGFSYHGNADTFDELLALHDRYHWDFVQIQLNYADWKGASGRNTPAEYLYAELSKRDIPSVIMEPLLGGRLANVPDHVADVLKEREPSRSIASWAFRFAGTPEKVLTVLSGMTYMEHLQDNLASLAPLKPLTAEELDFLEEVAKLLLRYPTIKCNDCKYCMPCPYGLDIPGIFTHYNKCVNEGFVSTSEESSDYRRNRRAYLVSYDRAIPTERQADRCISCGRCVPHCPQRIRIPAEMLRISRYVEELRRGGK